MRALMHQVLRPSSYEEGLRLGRELIARFKHTYTSAMECLEDDLEKCLAYLKLSEAHWRATRTTNLLERLFGEGKWCTKVIPRFPDRPPASDRSSLPSPRPRKAGTG
jgi:transposase-like protein